MEPSWNREIYPHPLQRTALKQTILGFYSAILYCSLVSSKLKYDSCILVIRRTVQHRLSPAPQAFEV